MVKGRLNQISKVRKQMRIIEPVIRTSFDIVIEWRVGFFKITGNDFRLVAAAALVARHFQDYTNVIESSERAYTTETRNSNRADVIHRNTFVYLSSCYKQSRFPL